MDKTYGKLLVREYPTREEMGKAAAQDAAKRIGEIVKAKGEANLIFASAPSQNEFLASLERLDVPWERVRAFHMDEYIGLPKGAPQSFSAYIKNALLGGVDVMEAYYMGEIEGAEDQRAAYANLLERYPPDLIFLGVGENGHLAFNDPPSADFNDPETVKIVELETECRQQQVNDGCFASLGEVPTHAMTITMPVIMRCAQAISVVPGERKAAAVARMLKGEISTECPASILREHGNAVMYIDRDSASLL